MGFNKGAIAKILSFIIIVLGASMVPSFFIALFHHEMKVGGMFLFLILFLVIGGASGVLLIRPKSSNLKIRDGFLTVALCWILASFLGTLPYLLSGVTDNFVDALFESTSGFSTTGATVLTNLESLPKSLLFWRSLSQWLGGMGIIIFTVSILPALGIGGQKIARAETPGPVLDKLAPRMTDSAKILYLIYFLFTLAATLLLLLGGLSPFDAVIHGLGCVATGGLSNYTEGVSHFNSLYVEIIISVFTILASINFTLYYHTVRGKWRNFFKDWELRVFFLILACAIVLISLDLIITNTVSSLPEALRSSFFQSCAFISTTGHFSSDFNLWPSFSKLILFLLMSIGACSASTGGGLKVIRVMVMAKLIVRGFQKRMHPRAVIPVKIQGRAIPQEMVSGIAAFFYLYIFIFLFSLFVMSFENMDLMSTLTAVSAVINNTGTGLELVGPAGSFAVFTPFSKIYLCILMMVGRLELFTIVLLFTPAFWNPDR